LDTSAIVDLLVAKERAGLDVSELTFAVVVWDAWMKAGSKNTKQAIRMLS